MSSLSIFYNIFTYTAVLVFILGITVKVWRYALTPSPLKIPTTPAPLTIPGSALRLTKEVLLFDSLFKSNKFIWVGGAAFHATLLVILISHLRYFVHPVPEVLMCFQLFFQAIGQYAGYVFLLSIIYLFIRRILIDRMGYISLLADYVVLGLIFCIGVSGVLLKFISRPDLVAVKTFVLGLVSFSPEPVPQDIVLLTHLTLVLVLLIYFPFSKLMHAVGILFSPTRHQIDNTREKRYINPWV